MQQYTREAMSLSRQPADSARTVKPSRTTAAARTAGGCPSYSSLRSGFGGTKARQAVILAALTLHVSCLCSVCGP